MVLSHFLWAAFHKMASENDQKRGKKSTETEHVFLSPCFCGFVFQYVKDLVKVFRTCIYVIRLSVSFRPEPLAPLPFCRGGKRRAREDRGGMRSAPCFFATN